ncbi:MAG: trigger factor [Planctomycetes bacterium]|nr:trigger factor [Planctomycetota bacterium]
MEINIEKTGPCLSKVNVVVSAQRVDEALDKNYKETAQSVAFPGFRKGKAPKKLVMKRFGDIIAEDVKEKLVQEAFGKAIEDHELEPVSEPNIDLSTLKLTPGESLEIAFEIETRPAFELGEYKGLEVEIPPVKVTDADVDGAIKAIRSRFASLTSFPDKEVDEKHYLTLDLVYHVDGEDDVTREQTPANLSLGVVDGIELKEELKQFKGKKVGDQVELEIAALPEHFVPENLRGKPARMEAKIKDIREVTFPELDEEFLKKVGLESIDELRKKVGDEVLESKKKKSEEETEQKIVDQLIKNHPFDIPEKLLMRQIDSQEQNMRYELLRMGLPPEKVAEESGKLDERNREAAERNIRSNFIFDKIAAKEKIYVMENEIDQELQIIAAQQNARVEEIRSYYQENNLLSGLRSFLRNQKIRKMLRDNASLVEKSGSERVESEEASSGDEGQESLG